MESEEFYTYVSDTICEFSHTTNLENIDSSVNRIVCILQTALDKFCPLIKVKRSRDNDKQKLWLTNEIKSLIKEKNKLHNKFIKKPLSYRQQYRTNRNRLNNVKKYAVKYHCSLLNNCRSNC